MKTLKELKKETKELEAQLEQKLKEREFKSKLIRFLKDMNPQNEGI